MFILKYPKIPPTSNNPKSFETDMFLFSSEQIQMKREQFFKGESTGIISSPSVPSVPPPQPPTQAPGSQVNNSSSNSATNATTVGGLTSPNAAPVFSSAKPRLPSAVSTAIPNDPSEDSNRRECARTAVSSAKDDSNKEAGLHHARPTPPTKPKELDGYVGFANLPNQVYRKAVKKGFEFTLMVVGP